MSWGGDVLADYTLTPGVPPAVSRAGDGVGHIWAGGDLGAGTGSCRCPVAPGWF